MTLTAKITVFREDIVFAKNQPLQMNEFLEKRSKIAKSQSNYIQFCQHTLR